MAIDTLGKRKSAASSRGGFRGGFVTTGSSGSGDALEATSQEILTKLGDISNFSDALRVLARGDAGTAGMVTALAEINTGGTATFNNTTGALESINRKVAKTEATAAGTLTGAGTATEVFVGSEVTVTVIADTDGNRSSVVVS